MIYELYSIKDTVVGNFSKPEVLSNVNHATRWFKDVCEGSKVRDDLQLYRLGTINIETGEIVSAVDFICGGNSF